MAASHESATDPTDRSEAIAQAMQRHLDSLTKPRGSLGTLETIATKLATIQGRVPPHVERKRAVVFAADHGVTSEGVSAYPQSVTGQMVRNFVSGGAAINVIADACGFDVLVVDCGLLNATGLSAVRDLRGGPGTANFAEKPAMTHEQLFRCIENGRELAGEIGGAGITPGADIVAVGDMGIGNTSTAAALAIALGASEEVIDRGTGISEGVLDTKRRIIAAAVARHAPYDNPYDAIRKVGGFDFATMVGFILGLRHRGIALVLDGFPVTAAAFVAAKIDSFVTDFMFAGHLSKVRGHKILLDELGLAPILSLEMHLGEGTGAVLGGFQVNLASRLASEMASFEEASVDDSAVPEETY
jgi:nicotinate-nucleotide--dimethylbenzimidazole phosphoribosyltransferase